MEEWCQSKDSWATVSDWENNLAMVFKGLISQHFSLNDNSSQKKPMQLWDIRTYGICIFVADSHFCSKRQQDKEVCDRGLTYGMPQMSQV